MTPSPVEAHGTMVLQLLPEQLLRLSLRDLDATSELLAAAAARGVTTIGDLLVLPPAEPEHWLDATSIQALRAAISRAIDRGLPNHTQNLPFDPSDWPSLQGHLLLPLDDAQRALIRALVGLDEPAITIAQYARRTGTDRRSTEALAERTRTRLHERSRALVPLLRQEVHEALTAFDGLLDPQRLGEGSMMSTLAEGNEDAWFPMRLAAFCFPHECHLHGGMLVAMSSQGMRRLLEQLRTTLARQRLPMPLDQLVAELEQGRKRVPRGLLAHLVQNDLRLSLRIEQQGEVIVPDPNSPTSRLVALLEEQGEAARLADLVFDYRERHRRATHRHLGQCLRRDPTFVQVGPDRFGLRSWYTTDFETATELAERAARHVCAEGGKQDVLRWLEAEGCDPRTAWLALDCIRRDGRVRLLGRGEACPATQRRSQVMVQLLVDLRRACGDVVESLFVENQPEHRRRLVRRLLNENRLFVRPDTDRVDLLTNYPFNEQRLRRLRKLTHKVLDERGGYTTIASLKEEVDATDLGGGWLSPTLLADIVRRHGWFDVLPGGIVALSHRALGATLLRLARQELREAGVQLTVAEILRQRPDLAEFTRCLAELLHRDPLVQSQDGRRFSLL